MPGTTPVKAWPYPLEADTPDVAADLHTLALALDVAPKSKVGTLASIPASGQSAGDVYEVVGDAAATNNGLGFVHNGSAWVALNQFRLVPVAATVSQTAAYGGGYICTAGITLTLPTAQAGQIVGVIAGSGATGASPITVSRGGGATITGVGLNAATSFVLGSPGAHALLWSDGTNWFLVSGQQDTGWVAVSLAGGVSAVGGTYTPGYRLQGDRVYLRGALNFAATASITVFTLPAGARPATGASFGPLAPGMNSGGIGAGGGLVLSGSSFTNAYLDAVNFGILA